MAPRIRLRKKPTEALLQPSDFTIDGAFELPGSCDFGGGLTGRYVSGNLRLYSTANDGTLKEFSVPTLTSSQPWNTATETNNYGDIYGSVIARAVDDGGGGTQPPPTLHSLTYARPTGVYWDPVDSRMYWTTAVGYNIAGDDCVIGYSTLNDGAHTGTGVLTCKFSSTYGGRFARGIVPIPSAFITSYGLGARRMALGFGGALSIISHQYSAGPALFAFTPLTAGTDPSEDYLNTTPTALVHYLTGTPSYRAPRDASLACYQEFGDAFDGTTNYWNWGDGYPVGIGGIWVNGASKQGVVFFAPITSGVGSAVTVVNTPSAPTHTVFYVDDASGFHVDDLIGVPTDTTTGNASYKFCYGRISGISGNQITWGSIKNAYTGAADGTGIPINGSSLKTGTFYIGGGTVSTRYEPTLYMYAPSALGGVAQGGSPNLTPYSMLRKTLDGQPTTFPGVDVGASPPSCKGAWYDETTKKAYAMYYNLPNQTGGRGLCYVFSVNA